MTRVNQKGEPIEEQQLFPHFENEATAAEIRYTITLLCEHLGVTIKRTNATKHGYTQVVLIKEPS